MLYINFSVSMLLTDFIGNYFFVSQKVMKKVMMLIINGRHSDDNLG